MSSETYNRLWGEAKDILTEAIRIDHFLKKAKPMVEKQPFHEAVCEAYYQYIVASNILQECYDQILQPQKRLLIRKLLDSCLGRILELKNDLEIVDLHEHSYNDDVLYRLKLSPNDVELKVPKYFRNDHLEDIKYKRKFIEDILKKIELEEPTEKKLVMTKSEAILVIQIHERARQDRLRSIFARAVYKLRKTKKLEDKKNPQVTFVSARMIQKVWRGFVERSKVWKHKLDEMLLLGMIPPTPKDTGLGERLENMKEKRRSIQTEHQEIFTKVMEEVEAKLREKKGIVIMEQITDEIRQLFRAFFIFNRRFPDFPSEEEGGSKAMIAAVSDDIARGRATKIKKKKEKKEKEEKIKKGKGKKEEKSVIPGNKVAETLLLPNLAAGEKDYEDTWKYKDERSNPQQFHHYDMVYKEKYDLLEREVRADADEMMRDELELLQEALDKDKEQEHKKRKKKKKKRSNKKKKKEKDLTADRTTESLFEELVANGIIKNYPEISIDSYIGEMSYAAYDFRNKEKFLKPCLGEIRHLVKQYCIMPMGSDTLRQMLPLTKSVLLAGPVGSGKKMLVCAICTALGAVLFDLSPSNIAGKYPGAEGLVMLMHLISKMTKLLQPSVVWVDEAEMTFIKRVPKEDTREPKRLKKDLPKFIKNISLEDRVVVIGTTKAPWDADKTLITAYQKIILIPRPDYGSIACFYRDYLRQFLAIGPFFDVSCITKLSEGYTIGEILKSLNNLLNTKRKLQLYSLPLTPKEILAALSKNEPISREENAAADLFWWKTPLGRQKAAIKVEEEKAKKKT